MSVVLKSHFYSDFSVSVNAYIIPRITWYSSTTNQTSVAISHIHGLSLADPGFYKRGHIEILLGALIHALIIEGKVWRGTLNEPIAMSSKLGWIISGKSALGSTSCLSLVSEPNESNFLCDLEKKARENF